MRLQLVRDGVVVQVVRVANEAITVGRDPSNSLVVTDPDVSAHHALITPDGPRLRDLRSTNGTFHNDRRVDGDVVLADGDQVRLASGCHLAVRAITLPAPASFALMDRAAGTLHRLDPDRTVIGSAKGAHIELPDGPACAAVVVQGDDELWLERAGEPDLGLLAGDSFEVHGRVFEVRDLAPFAAGATVADAEAGPCALFVDLQAPGGPIARVTDARGHRYTVDAESRAVLLYVLGRQRRDDLARGLGDDAGWVSDEEVVMAVWGRSGSQRSASGYSVLVHRVRRELADAGFPPRLLEKRRGALRVVAAEVTLAGG